MSFPKTEIHMLNEKILQAVDINGHVNYPFYACTRAEVLISVHLRQPYYCKAPDIKPLTRRRLP